MIAVVLTKKSLSIRPYCQVKGVSCTWLGSPPQGDQIKSAIMKTYLAAHVGKLLRLSDQGWSYCDIQVDLR